MADILTLPQAREALGWKDDQNVDRDELLEDRYIPAVTRIVERMCGRMEDRTETWVTDAAASVTTPWTSGTVREVRSVRTRYARSTALSGYTYTYTLGALTFANVPSGRVEVTVGNLPTPPDVILAAGIILAHLWNADKQGMSSQSVIRSEAPPTPQGFAIPRRAAELLSDYSGSGFA